MRFQPTAESRATTTSTPAVTSRPERTTLRVSSPRASRSTIARDVVCSTGRKRTTTARNIAAHSTAMSPYASGPSERAARTWKAYVSTPDATIATDSRAAPECTCPLEAGGCSSGALTAATCVAVNAPPRR